MCGYTDDMLCRPSQVVLTVVMKQADKKATWLLVFVLFTRQRMSMEQYMSTHTMCLTNSISFYIHSILQIQHLLNPHLLFATTIITTNLLVKTKNN